MHSGSRCNEEAVSCYAQLRVACFLAGEPCEAYTETTVCHLFSKTKTSATTVRERFGEPPTVLPSSRTSLSDAAFFPNGVAIPVSRPSLCRVPPGMRSIPPHKWQSSVVMI